MSIPFNLTWDQARTLLNQGYTVEHESFKNGDYLYLLTSKRLCEAFKYGYGEYDGEPTFIDTVVEVVNVDRRLYSSGKILKLGYEPSRYIQSEGWRVRK
ncbi:hypothetical protein AARONPHADGERS_262 [Bacillus phage AaronPhadgers]|nr:hypothetical protein AARONPHADGERS_262 [Bacillus phage AaronPhadgers]